MINNLPKDIQDKCFKEYSKTINKITQDIIISEVESDNFEDYLKVQALVADMTNDFHIKFREYGAHKEMTDAEHEIVVNVIHEGLLNISGKFEFFTPTQEMINNTILGLTKLLLFTEVIINENLKDE